MNKNEKIMIGILVIITAIVIIVAIARKKDSKQEIAEETNTQQ